jgi:hypothetical protein
MAMRFRFASSRTVLLAFGSFQRLLEVASSSWGGEKNLGGLFGISKRVVSLPLLLNKVFKYGPFV